MEQFEGRWKQIEADNSDEYLKELDVPFVLRKVAGVAKAGSEFTKEADGRWTYTFHSTVKTGSFTFNLGVESEEATPDGRHVKSTVVIENGKLIHTQVPIKAGEKGTVTERWIEDGKMISVSKVGNVVARFVDVKV